MNSSIRTNVSRWLSTRTMNVSLVALGSLPLGCVSLFLYFYFPAKFETRTMEQVIKRANAMSLIAAHNLGVGQNDASAITREIGALRQNRDVEFIVIRNPEGKVLSAVNVDTTNLSSRGDVLSQKNQPSAATYISVADIKNGERILGQLFLGISLAEQREEAGRTRTAVALLSLAIFSFGIISAIAISMAATGPLRCMVEAAKAIAGGDLTKRADSCRQSEVSQLAEAFNVMVDNLVATQCELEGLHRILEQRVESRTVELSAVNERLRREILERRQGDERLERERNLLQTLIDNLPDRIYAKDIECRFILNNETHLRALGAYTKEYAFGKTDFDFRPRYLAERYSTDDFDVICSGKPLLNREEETVFPSGESGWLLSTKVPLRDAQGNVVGLVGISRDITKRKHAEDQLALSLREKEVLLKEIHHRVKNNLQVISSLLNLQADSVNDLQAQECLRVSQNRVKSMALIHERLYQSSDLARIDFAEYVNDLTSFLRRSWNIDGRKILLESRIENLTLGIDTAIPCGLIINELVSNALKYAFSAMTTGEIVIAVDALEDRKLRLSVSDNGIGFPKNIDFRATDSLGLQLVTTLTQQLKGRIEMENGRGTKFIITFAELQNNSGAT